VKVTVDLPIEATRRLVKLAVRERRPLPLQLEVLVLQALGLWPPPDENQEREDEARRQCSSGGQGAARPEVQIGGGARAALRY